MAFTMLLLKYAPMASSIEKSNSYAVSTPALPSPNLGSLLVTLLIWTELCTNSDRLRHGKEPLEWSVVSTVKLIGGK